MLQTQFNKLKNIATQSNYKYNNIYLNDQNVIHFKNRAHQIANQFDLLDYQKKGYLYKGQILNYLQNKYQWINKKIVDQLFNTMNWKKLDRNDQLFVQRQQFCTKYLAKQKQLFYQTNRLYSQQKWFSSLYNIYKQTRPIRPQYYASVHIKRLQFYKNCDQQYVNIDIKYQDHKQKLQFNINQTCYDITKPSFQLILPVQQNQFFISYNFTHVKDHTKIYGHSNINVDMNDQNIPKLKQLKLQVKKHGELVGRCTVIVAFQSRHQVVQQKLKLKLDKIHQNQKHLKTVNMTLVQLKQKQYEYIQFLWGIKHMPSQKIQQKQVPYIIAFRTLLIFLLGGLGLVVHVLGRSEPLSIICAFLMLKWRTYVILKVEVFLMSWLIIAAMLLDAIWLVFSSHHVSQINYLNLPSAMVLTYILFGVKVLFFIYLIVFERPFKTNQQKFNIQHNNQIN